MKIFFPLISSTVNDLFWVKSYIWNEIKVSSLLSKMERSDIPASFDFFKKCSFPTDLLWLLCQDLIHCLYVCLFLDSLFCCTDLHVRTHPFPFSVSTFCGVRKGNNWSPKSSKFFSVFILNYFVVFLNHLH